MGLCKSTSPSTNKEGKNNGKVKLIVTVNWLSWPTKFIFAIIDDKYYQISIINTIHSLV